MSKILLNQDKENYSSNNILKEAKNYSHSKDKEIYEEQKDKKASSNYKRVLNLEELTYNFNNSKEDKEHQENKQKYIKNSYSTKLKIRNRNKGNKDFADHLNKKDFHNTNYGINKKQSNIENETNEIILKTYRALYSTSKAQNNKFIKNNTSHGSKRNNNISNFRLNKRNIINKMGENEEKKEQNNTTENFKINYNYSTKEKIYDKRLEIIEKNKEEYNTVQQSKYIYNNKNEEEREEVIDSNIDNGDKTTDYYYDNGKDRSRNYNNDNINNIRVDSEKHYLMGEIAKLKKVIGELKMNIKELETKEKVLIYNNKDLEEKYNKLKKEKEQTDKDIIELNIKIRKYEKENKEMNDKNDLDNKEKEILENKINELKEENESLNKIIKEKDSLNEEINEEINNLNKEKSENQTKIEKYATQLKNLENECSEYKKNEAKNKNDSEELNKLILENESLKKKNEELNKSLKELNEQVDSKNVEIENIKKKIEENKLKNDDENKKDEKENNDDNGGIEDNLEESLKEKINKIEIEKQNLQEELEKVKNKVNEYQNSEGKIKDYKEFCKMFDLLFSDFKPEEMEKKEALIKIKKILSKE